MRLFRRDQGETGSDKIDEFWSWWASARDRIASSIADGSAASVAGEISGRVHRIDSRLAWELAPGTHAQHALVVTPEGNAEVRPNALRWIAKAPDADAVWEYHASRQAGELGTLGIGGAAVRLEDMRAIASWDEARQVVDVRLWHPTFGSLPPGVPQQIAFLFLDGLLGEDDVERWVGSIEVLRLETGGKTPEELRDEVSRRAESASGDAWVLGERTDRDGPAVVSANAALKRIDHPYASHHLLVTVDRGLEQLAGSPEAQELNTAEDALVATLEATGATFAGRVTARRQRRIHFACPDPDRAVEAARAWASLERRFGPRVDVEPDPTWKFRADLIGLKSPRGAVVARGASQRRGGMLGKFVMDTRRRREGP